MKYDVVCRIAGYYTTTVDAASYEEAKEKAEATYKNVGFDQLENIDCRTSIIDEDGILHSVA